MTSKDHQRGATILHISDTQFGQYHRFAKHGADSLAGHLVLDLREMQKQGVPPIDIIVISGDIAETGFKGEYVDAKLFVDALLDHTGLDTERVVLVPGNHDLNWNLSRSYFLECEGDGVPCVEPYTRKWRHYQGFVNEIHGPVGFTEEQPYRLYQYDQLGVVIAALNSTMRESHRDEDHYGWCGLEQLRWFADRLEQASGLVRIGVLHHNVRRKAEADNENLRDEEDLTRHLGPYLDLVLHGHTHNGKEDRLSDGTLVLGTGSTAITADWRPSDVPNQYQILSLQPDGLTRWARQWSERTWIGDTRVSNRPNDGSARLNFNLDSRKGTRRRQPRGNTSRDRATEEFVTQVEFVTRRDVGEALIDRKSMGEPRLNYLLVVRKAAPRRCVGIIDGPLNEETLKRFDSLVFSPLRDPGGLDLLVVHRGPDLPIVRDRAQERGIQVKTWNEYNDLLEPSAYSDWLKAQLITDPLYPLDLYIPQRFVQIDRFGNEVNSDANDDILEDIYRGILDDESRFVLVLGEAGYGKSFLVRKLAYRIIDNENVALTPIVIHLRDRDKRQTIEEMVSNVLLPSRAAFNSDRFQHSLETGALALLIDGYDEFAVRVGYSNAAAQLQTFIGVLRGRAKVLLTTRPNHFRSTDELTSRLFHQLKTVNHGRVYQLEPFAELQQRKFLTRWFDLRGDHSPEAVANRWMNALAGVDNLPELAKTPRMLSFMVEDLSLDDLEQAGRRGTVTAAGLYQKLVERWLESEAGVGQFGNDVTVSAEDRWLVLEALAEMLWKFGERDVGEEALQQAAQVIDLPVRRLTLDQAAHLLGGRTLLRVNESRWKFAHQSVWEFLLAKRLARLMQSDGGSALTLGEAELTSLTLRFLRDLVPGEGAKWLARVAGES